MLLVNSQHRMTRTVFELLARLLRSAYPMGRRTISSCPVSPGSQENCTNVSALWDLAFSTERWIGQSGKGPILVGQ